MTIVRTPISSSSPAHRSFAFNSLLYPYVSPNPVSPSSSIFSYSTPRHRGCIPNWRLYLGYPFYSHVSQRSIAVRESLYGGKPYPVCFSNSSRPLSVICSFVSLLAGAPNCFSPAARPVLGGIVSKAKKSVAREWSWYPYQDNPPVLHLRASALRCRRLLCLPGPWVCPCSIAVRVENGG